MMGYIFLIYKETPLLMWDSRYDCTLKHQFINLRKKIILVWHDLSVYLEDILL